MFRRSSWRHTSKRRRKTNLRSIYRRRTTFQLPSFFYPLFSFREYLPAICAYMPRFVPICPRNTAHNTRNAHENPFFVRILCILLTFWHEIAQNVSVLWRIAHCLHWFWKAMCIVFLYSHSRRPPPSSSSRTRLQKSTIISPHMPIVPIILLTLLIRMEGNCILQREFQKNLNNNLLQLLDIWMNVAQLVI